MKRSKIAARSVLIVLLSALVVFAAMGFAACDGLTSSDSIKIQDTSLDMDYVTTYTDGEILYVREGDEFTVVGIDQEYGGLEIVIPDTVRLNDTDYPVVAIADRAFYKCSLRTSVVVSDTVTSIGSYAFSDCTGLESVSIGKGVTSIGSYAFNDCTNVNEIYFDAASASVNSNSFNNVGKDAEDGVTVCIGKDAESVPGSLCRYMYNVTDVVFEEDSACESIGDYAFYNCTKLENISLPNSITSIGSYAFYGCVALPQINMPEALTTINSYAFSGCEELSEINMPEALTTISGYAFYGCSSLRSVIVPSGVEYIGQAAFSNCESLTAIYYCGSEADWSNVSGAKTIPSGVTLYYYSETQPDGENYWHYDADGAAVIWQAVAEMPEDETPEEDIPGEDIPEEDTPE